MGVTWFLLHKVSGVVINYEWLCCSIVANNKMTVAEKFASTFHFQSDFQPTVMDHVMCVVRLKHSCCLAVDFYS